MIFEERVYLSIICFYLIVSNRRMGNSENISPQETFEEPKINILKEQTVSSLNPYDLEEPAFPIPLIFNAKNSPSVVNASKNILGNVIVNRTTPPSEEKQNLENQVKKGKTVDRQRFTVSERVKIKRPQFKKVVIELGQFIRVMTTPIRNDYELQTKIGSGSYGSVYRSKDRKTGDIFAIKMIQKSKLSSEEYQNLVNQFYILRRMDHPNIVKLYCLYDDKKYMYVVTELCQGGNLLDTMNQLVLSEDDIRIIMAQMLSAVTFMHNLKIVHKDIKPENIVLVKKVSKSTVRNIQIKFIDFGISVDLTNNKIAESDQLHGTVLFMPPESMQGIVRLSWDIWSCGIICYMMATRKTPYRTNHGQDLFNQIQKANIIRRRTHYFYLGLQSLSKQFKVFIVTLLNKSYLFRITAEKALKDPWIKKSLKQRKLTKSESEFTVNALQSYKIKNNFLSMIESYLACKKINQQERQHLASIFQSIDEDKSGIIDVQELRKFYKQNSQHYQKDQFQKLIEALDKNNSGKIDFNEFITGMCSRRKLFQLQSLGQAFDFIDRDHSGQLSRQEIRDLLLGVQNQQIEDIFKKLDLNNDEKISKTEFLAYFQKMIEE